jgi:hypothetical protein
LGAFVALALCGFTILALSEAIAERGETDTIVRYTSGETRCFEGMKHTTEEGFVRLYDREKEITIPKSRVVNVHTSKSACE